MVTTAGCAQEPVKRSSTPTPEATPEPSTVATPKRSSRKRWVHFGDSFTRVSKVAPALGELTGYMHLDASVPGDNSLTAAIRSGSIGLKGEVLGGKIPSSGDIEVLNFAPHGYKMLEQWDYNAEILGVRGILILRSTDGKVHFERNRPGHEVDAPGASEIILDPTHEQQHLGQGFHTNSSIVFAIGRNDLDTQQEVGGLVAHIRVMIDKHPAEQVEFVVTEIPPWQNEKIGTPEREKLDAWNNRLKEEFGDRYIEPVQWVLKHLEKSLSLADKRMTRLDRPSVESGVIPVSLKEDERGHFSIDGGKAWAMGMYEEFKRLHLV